MAAPAGETSKIPSPFSTVIISNWASKIPVLETIPCAAPVPVI